MCKSNSLVGYFCLNLFLTGNYDFVTARYIEILFQLTSQFSYYESVISHFQSAREKLSQSYNCKLLEASE